MAPPHPTRNEPDPAIRTSQIRKWMAAAMVLLPLVTGAGTFVVTRATVAAQERAQLQSQIDERKQVDAAQQKEIDELRGLVKESTAATNQLAREISQLVGEMKSRRNP